MEKGKISQRQLFSLMVLFEIGSAIVVGLGMKAKQDAWLAILLGMIGGLVLFLIYGYLFQCYPNIPLTSYIEKIMGKYIGKIVALGYNLYFLYIATRVLRDFGELNITTILHETPLSVINFLFILVVGYGCYLGIEVLGRTGEIFFIVIMILGILFTALVFISRLPKMSNLLPVLEDGWGPVLSTTFPLTLSFPFGEMIVFTMLLPYLNQSKNGIRGGLLAILLSGLILSCIIAINISVLGPFAAEQAAFPLYKTTGKINIGDFIQRLDVIAVIILIVGGFFKIAIFFYAALIGLADLFKVKKYQTLIIPCGIILVISSLYIADNYVKHIEIGLEKVPIYLHIPFQIIIPIILALITVIKKRFFNLK